MRLVTFGCSFTYGQGLPDCYNIHTNEPGKFPSKSAWPQLLADKLMLECINVSEPGSSNKEILNKLLNFKINDNDIVVTMWSFPDRWCCMSNTGITRIDLENRNTLIAYDNIFTEYDLEFDLVYRANFAKLFLDNRKIKNYHLCVNTDYCKLVDDISWNAVVFSKINMCSIKLMHPPALDVIFGDYHPGVGAHYELTELLHTELLQLLQSD